MSRVRLEVRRVPPVHRGLRERSARRDSQEGRVIRATRVIPAHRDPRARRVTRAIPAHRGLRENWAREARKVGPASRDLKVSRVPRVRRVTRAIPGPRDLRVREAREVGPAFEVRRGRQGHGDRPAPEGRQGETEKTVRTVRTEPMALRDPGGREAGLVRRDPEG